MKYYKLGETFEYEGQVMTCVPDEVEGECTGCAFYREGCSFICNCREEGYIVKKED